MSTATPPILTGRAADPWFKKGTPYAVWQNGINGHRYATDREVRAEYGCDREQWLAAWRELSGKRGTEWVPWLQARRSSGFSTSKEAEKQEAHNPQAAIDIHQPGRWRGYGMQQPKIGAQR